MAERGEKPERPWYRDPIKVLTLVTLLVGLPIGFKQLYDEVFRTTAPAVSVLYVLDVSNGMAGEIGGKQKLAAAKDEIISAVRGTPDIAYAVRLAGPGCSETYRSPSVSFAEDNGDEVEAALAPVTAAGTSDFARSVRYAVNDVVAQQSEEGSGSASLVFLFGGPDQCTTRPETVVADALRFLERDKTIDVSFKFIGVKVTEGTRKLLNLASKRAQQLGFGSTVEYANTPAELGESVSGGRRYP